MSYTPPTEVVDASWVGGTAYSRPENPHPAWWGTTDNGTGIRRLAPSGWHSLRIQQAKLYRDWEYPPPFLDINASWMGAQSYAPATEVLNVAWARAAGADQYIVAAGVGDASHVGEHQVSNTRYIEATGWSLLAFGAPALRQVYTRNGSWVGAAQYRPPGPEIVHGWWSGVLAGTVFPIGVRGWSFGTLSIINKAAQVRPPSIDSALELGAATVWNWRQYANVGGLNANAFGVAYVQGGVKFVTPPGLQSFASGGHTVINTTANRTLVPAGIAPPIVLIGGVNYQIPPPTVSPRFLRPSGIYGTEAGIPRVQFPPQPLGWLASAFGYPVVEYKTKIVHPAGVASFAEGFPRVADRARKVFHSASAVTAVFGDVQVRAKNFRVSVPGLLSLEMAPWTEVRNTRRILPVVGILAPGVGAGSTAHNKTPSLSPAGFDSSEFGRLGHTVVGWRIRSVRPSGVPVPFPQFGAASLWQTPSLAPAGILAPAVPAPTVWPGVRRVSPVGSDMQKVQSPTVWFSYRIIVAEGRGIAGTSYGTARIEHDRRGIAMLGAGYMAFGTAWVSRRVRMLAPSGIPDVLLSKHQVGGTRWLGPEGFEATRWLTRITPESREVFPATITATYGVPTVQNKVRPVFLTGIRTYPDDWRHWGVAKVWNRRQIITMVEDQESGLWPLPWPQWTAIENRNRTIGGIGFNAGRFGGPLVANNARLLHPSGVAHPTLPEYQKTGSVTHRVRPLPVDGIEPPPMPRWAVVHNAARPLLPQGAVATLWGQTELVNLRRFRQVQGFYSTEFGYPMVADRIRTLSFESRYGIQPPRIELPKVHLHTRYVEPLGMANPGVGNASLTIFFRRATPRWTHRELFGDPFVWNKTPELRTRGRASDEYGDTFVRLEWRPVAPEGRDMQLFGLTRISDRRQRLEVPGMTRTVVSDKVTVRRFGEEPVATQYIDLRRYVIGSDNTQVELDEGFGIPYPWPSMGVPDLLKGYIFHGKGPGQDHDMLTMGRPVVSANSIRVEPGIFDFYIGEPFVSLRRRRVDVPTLGQLIVDSQDRGAGMGSWGKPRLSPHTIYAVMEAPLQAMRNHGMNPTALHPVHRSVSFGRVHLSMWNGLIQPIGIAGSGALGTPGTTWGVGVPRLINKRQYVATTGTLMQRLGWPVIPGPQNIVIEVPIAQHAMGTPKVAPPPYVGPSYILAGAISFQSFGPPLVEYRTRTVRPTGWSAMAVSTSAPGGVPGYMPQHLYIGPRMPVIPAGFDATRYGTPWVSNRVRGLEHLGHDSFVSEYDYQNFAKRMRVRNANDSWGGRRSVLTHGHQSSRVGAPGVRPGTHYIRPDGNSDQYRKGAF